MLQTLIVTQIQTVLGALHNEGVGGLVLFWRLYSTNDGVH